MAKKLILRNVLLIGLIPFVFACSKSKFSAKKETAIPVTQTNQPRVDPGTTVRPCQGPHCPPPQTCQGFNCHPVEPPIVADPFRPPVIIEPIPRPPVVVRPPQPVGPVCDTYENTLNGYKKGAQKVNLWLVVDTSKSYHNNRVAATKALMDTYVNGLSRQTEVTFSVITGHSPESNDSVAGSPVNDFFYRQANEASVIRFYPGMGKTKRKKAIDDLLMKISGPIVGQKNGLSVRGGMRVDNSRGISDGGELLMKNLTDALRPDRLSVAQKMGAFSPKNALGIIFMSDENDICTPGQKPSTKMKTKNGRVSREKVSYSKYCRGTNIANGAEALEILSELKAQNQLKYLFASGFIYTSNGDHSGQVLSGQNEKGLGYISFIKSVQNTDNPVIFDLGSIREGQRLGWAKEKAHSLAKLTDKAADLHVYQQIRRDGKVVPGDGFVPSRTEITVDGRRLTNDQFSYRQDQNDYQISGCGPKSKIVIKYCGNGPKKIYKKNVPVIVQRPVYTKKKRKRKRYKRVCYGENNLNFRNKKSSSSLKGSPHHRKQIASYTPSEVKEILDCEGAVVFSTGGRTYKKIVSNRYGCLAGEQKKAFRLRGQTVGYTCVDYQNR